MVIGMSALKGRTRFYSKEDPDDLNDGMTHSFVPKDD